MRLEENENVDPQLHYSDQSVAQMKRMKFEVGCEMETSNVVQQYELSIPTECTEKVKILEEGRNSGEVSIPASDLFQTQTPLEPKDSIKVDFIASKSVEDIQINESCMLPSNKEVSDIDVTTLQGNERTQSEPQIEDCTGVLVSTQPSIETDSTVTFDQKQSEEVGSESASNFKCDDTHCIDNGLTTLKKNGLETDNEALGGFHPEIPILPSLMTEVELPSLVHQIEIARDSEEKPSFPVKLLLEDTEDSEIVTVEEDETDNSVTTSSTSSLTEYAGDGDFSDDSDELLGVPNPTHETVSHHTVMGGLDEIAPDKLTELASEPEIEEIEPLPAEELNFRRFKSQFRLKLSWERIFEKYGRDFDSDEIDLQTGEVHSIYVGHR
jgi:hypothetical protein